MLKFTQYYQTILSRFLPLADKSGVQIRDVVANDYDSRIIRLSLNDQSYYLVESDHIETDETYQRIATAYGDKIIHKVPLLSKFVSSYPRRTPKMQHDFADMRDEWGYVYEDKSSSRLYCLYRIDGDGRFGAARPGPTG